MIANAAFIHGLGFDGLRKSSAPAADLLTQAIGENGGRAISLLICLSCLSAIHGMTLTGGRIYYALGRDHAWFSKIGQWNERRQTPLAALVLQAVITLGIVIGFGGYENGFARMVIFTAPIFWFFMLLAGVSLIVLRLIEPNMERPFRTPLFPLFPLIFMATCGLLVWSSMSYAISQGFREVLWSAVLIAVGIVLAIVSPRRQGN